MNRLFVIFPRYRFYLCAVQIRCVGSHMLWAQIICLGVTGATCHLSEMWIANRRF